MKNYHTPEKNRLGRIRNTNDVFKVRCNLVIDDDSVSIEMVKFRKGT